MLANAEKAYEEFAEASRSTAIDSRNGILTEVLGQLLGRGKQPKSKLACFPKETKYTREDSNLQPSVPKTDFRNLIPILHSSKLLKKPSNFGFLQIIGRSTK